MMTREKITAILRTQRIRASLEAKGYRIECKSHKKYSNFTMTSNGYIDNATVTTLPARWELSGDTYPVKDLAKKVGFRWDPKRKVWFHKDINKSVTAELGALILRRLSN